MRHRVPLLTVGFLLFGMPATPLLGVATLQAQGPRFGVRPVEPAAAAPATQQPDLIRIPDSTHRYPPTHWKTGLLIGGIVGGALGAALGGGLCRYSDASGNCTGAALGGALMLGSSAGAVGALLGGLFPRQPKRPAQEEARQREYLGIYKSISPL